LVLLFSAALEIELGLVLGRQMLYCLSLISSPDGSFESLSSATLFTNYILCEFSSLVSS
jgi:hypothetical protein